jgi:glutamyl-Q tRNA(Asp) synthetase
MDHHGTFLLRMEDIDQTRARAHWEAQIYDDLTWLGLDWPTPVMRQSERQSAYDAALDVLWEKGLLYPCTCSRADIAAAASAPQEGAPLHGPDGLIYPGACRNTPRTGPRPENVALRLDMSKAVENISQLHFDEKGSEACTVRIAPQTLSDTVGDVVLARRDMGTSYHLSVVVDDAAQLITHVVRGEDLFDATQIHVVLQYLLGYPTPIYHHHHLVRDDMGKRLAKRDDARAISLYRSEGRTPEDIISLSMRCCP